MVEIIQVEAPHHITQLRALLDEFIAYTYTFHDDPEEHDNLPTFKNVDQELEELPGIYAPPTGRFLVAVDEDEVVGCVALKKIDDTTSEVKRMYVRPSHRGQKLGYQLMQRLISEARAIGYSKVILGSHQKMVAAHSVYRKVGFVDIPAPDDVPELVKELAIFMEMDLGTN